MGQPVLSLRRTVLCRLVRILLPTAHLELST